MTRMLRPIRLVLLPLLFALSACEGPNSTEIGKVMRLEKVESLVNTLGEEIDIPYDVSPQVWHDKTAVISIEVDDSSADYASVAGSIASAASVRDFEGELLVVFQQQRPITAKERTAGLKSNTLTLATFDAKSGKRR